MAWIIVAFLAGAVAALVFAVTYGHKNKTNAEEMFRKSAVLGVYCARIRSGEIDPSIEDVKVKAKYITDHAWEADGE